jgi:hypothetical protein
MTQRTLEPPDFSPRNLDQDALAQLREGAIVAGAARLWSPIESIDGAPPPLVLQVPLERVAYAGLESSLRSILPRSIA